MTREESDKRLGGEGFDHVGSTPCNTLIIRGLDALTTEGVIKNFLETTSNSTLPIKSCLVARDSFTNVSMGFCFVEMTSITDAGYMLQLLQPCIEIDGKQLIAHYSKNSFKTALNQIESQTIKSYQQKSLNENIYTHHPTINNRTNQGDQANNAASVAQAAMLLAQKKQEVLSQITSSFKQQHQPDYKQEESSIQPNMNSTIGDNLKFLAKQVDTANKVYTTPDITTFTYDDTSGYYYDYSTGFYYDASSQYYFNSLTQQYMYWDPVNSTYIPIDSSGTTETTTTNTTPNTPTSNTTNTDDNLNKLDTDLRATTNESTNVIESTETSAGSNKLTVNSKPLVKTAAQIAKVILNS
jgi:RNA-binding protein 5/10